MLDKTSWVQIVSPATDPDGISSPEEEMAASNACSILQAQSEPGWTARAIAAGRTPDC